VQPGTQPYAADGYGPQQEISPQEAAQKRRAAIIEAMGANHPEIRELGKSLWSEQVKNANVGKLTAKDVFNHATPGAQEVLAGQSGIEGFKALPQKPLEVNGVLLKPDSYEVIKAVGTAPEQIKFNGDLYEKNPTTGQWKKLDNAPKVNVNATTNVVNKGETEFSKELGKDTAGQVKAAREQMMAAQKLIPNLDKLEQLNKSGVLSGPTAEPTMFLGELAKNAGIPFDPKKLTNSEEYKSTLGKQIAQYLTAGNGVGRSLTDADRKALESQFPEMVRTPEGRSRIITLLRTTAHSDIQQGQAVEAAIAEQFPELKRLRNVAPANSAPYPQNTSPTPSGTPIIRNW
jgi:hypothetical protein